MDLDQTLGEKYSDETRQYSDSRFFDRSNWRLGSQGLPRGYNGFYPRLIVLEIRSLPIDGHILHL